MKTLTASKELTSDDLVDQVQDGHIVLLRNGKLAAVVMSLDEDDRDWLERELDPEFIASIARGREEIRQGQGVSHEEVVKMFGLR